MPDESDTLDACCRYCGSLLHSSDDHVEDERPDPSDPAEADRLIQRDADAGR